MVPRMRVMCFDITGTILDMLKGQMILSLSSGCLVLKTPLGKPALYRVRELFAKSEFNFAAPSLVRGSKHASFVWLDGLSLFHC